MRRWKVTIGSPMVLTEIGKALAQRFGASYRLFGHSDDHFYRRARQCYFPFFGFRMVF
jgi:hypothetical protein